MATAEFQETGGREKCKGLVEVVGRKGGGCETSVGFYRYKGGQEGWGAVFS